MPSELAMRIARDVQWRIGHAAWIEIEVEMAAKIIDAEIVPMLAENERLKTDFDHEFHHVENLRNLLTKNIDENVSLHQKVEWSQKMDRFIQELMTSEVGHEWSGHHGDAATILGHRLSSLRQQVAELEAENEKLGIADRSVRSSHAKICRKIKSLLGYKNWPDIEGNFVDGMLQLLEESFRSAALKEPSHDA